MKLAVALLLTMLLSNVVSAQAGKSGSQSATDPDKASTEPQAPSTGSSTPAQVKGNLEVLTDTQGVDFGPYLSKVLKSVRQHWYELIPTEARPPEMKAGKVAIEFVILRDGKIAGVTLRASSRAIPLDRAAWGAITTSAPFAPLPEEFHGPYLALRFHFLYNPSKMSQEAAKPDQE